MENTITLDDTDAGGEANGVSVHAGFPNPAADRRLRGLDLNQLLIRHPASTFMFRIRGERGITVGIFDGDIAIVDRIKSPSEADYVLWHNEQGFKLSRPNRMTDGGTLWGVIIAVIHQYQ